MSNLGSNPELWIALISTATAVIVGGLTSFLTYFFTVRSKLKDLEVEKKKDLNQILSDLLDIWFQTNRLEMAFKIIKSPENFLFDNPATLFLIFKYHGLNPEKIGPKLEKSIKSLKNKDAITYFKLKGIGDSYKAIFQIIHEVSLNPQSVNYDSNSGDQPLILLIVIFEALENAILEVSRKIGSGTKRKTKKIFEKIKQQKSEDLLKDMNDIYALAVQSHIKNTSPEGEEIPTKKAIIKELKNDSKKMKLISNEAIKGFFDKMGKSREAVEFSFDYEELLKIGLAELEEMEPENPFFEEE